VIPTETVIIAGPTGVGKTALALTLAERLGGEIVGAEKVIEINYKMNTFKIYIKTNNNILKKFDLVTKKKYNKPMLIL